MNYERIVTLFDTAQHAEAAKRNLESAGFPPGEISTINNHILAGDKLHEPGLWRRLFGRDIQNYEAIVYGRSVENGGVVLTVRVPEADVPKATRILNAHETVNLQQRAIQQGLVPDAATAPTATMAADRPHPEDVGKRGIDDATTRIRRARTDSKAVRDVDWTERTDTVRTRGESDKTKH